MARNRKRRNTRYARLSKSPRHYQLCKELVRGNRNAARIAREYEEDGCCEGISFEVLARTVLRLKHELLSNSKYLTDSNVVPQEEIERARMERLEVKGYLKSLLGKGT